MQINNKLYNPKYHEQHHALCIRQPFASDLIETWTHDDEGNAVAMKSVEIRNHRARYFGDVLICSRSKVEVYGYLSGAALGFVELYDCKHVSQFTPEDWDKTRIPKQKRMEIVDGFGWFFRNPRKVVEIPIRGRRGFGIITLPKDEIIEYPQIVQLDIEV